MKVTIPAYSVTKRCSSVTLTNESASKMPRTWQDFLSISSYVEIEIAGVATAARIFVDAKDLMRAARALVEKGHWSSPYFEEEPE